MKKNNDTRTSPLLFLFCVIMCFIAGALVSQPKAGPSPMKETGVSDIIAEANLDTRPAEALTGSEEEGAVESVDAVQEPETENTQLTEEASDDILISDPGEASEKETESEESTAEAKTDSTDDEKELKTDEENTKTGSAEASSSDSGYTPSAEASEGTWIKGTGEWFFRVGDQNYHGWLYDVDHHIYYLNPENGVMTTGWAEIDGKTYYFSQDGVMQTGRIEAEGKVYDLNEDGTLNDSESPAEISVPDVIITAVPTTVPKASTPVRSRNPSEPQKTS